MTGAPSPLPLETRSTTSSSSNSTVDDSVFLTDHAHGSDDEPRGEYTGVFEGPEKTLEVVFRPRRHNPQEAEPWTTTGTGDVSSSATVLTNSSTVTLGGVWSDAHPQGLRRLTRTQLDAICARARCTILSQCSNQYLDAYVLSESSLFVYPYMLVLKTCGTTTLLRCVTLLIDYGRSLGLDIEWLGYSRKNFNFPGDQIFPHQSFAQELKYLESHKSMCERLNGNGYTLGPLTGDHWFVFVADQTLRSVECCDTDRVLNIMMFDIDETVAQQFYSHNYPSSADEDESTEDRLKRIAQAQTKAAGIDALCPGAIIDSAAFEPCGYSMNAILFRSYTTMHITPESTASYASFETNQKVPSYASLIRNVLGTFRPKRFVLTLMADELGLNQLKENPLTASGPEAKIVVPVQSQKVRYKRTSSASIKVEDDNCCLMGNWVLEQGSFNNEASIDQSSGQPYKYRPRGMTFS